MKNVVKTIIVLCVLFIGYNFLVFVENFTASVEAAEYDFRKTRWGMSRTDVIKSEEKEPTLEGESVTGSQFVAYRPIPARVGETNHELAAMYYFVENQLYFAKYHIFTEHSNENDFLTDFEDFKLMLSKKYGTLQNERIVFKNDRFKDRPENWGSAIAMGELEKYATWETETTTIVLRLIGDNYDISFEVRYETKDKKLLALEQQLHEKKKEETF